MFRGGLSTKFDALLSNFWLSGTVAMIGISAPIALSFTLQKLVNATPVQAFAAGAALCSTSLGTTFTILSTSGLDKSRLGVILSSAAMIDDVFGLVMTQIISSLGTPSGSFSAITVVRPVFVSIAFAVVVPLVCRLIIQPLTVHVLNKQFSEISKRKYLAGPSIALAVHTLILIGLVTGSSYASTSNLFAAYIAGAGISWWDELATKILKQRDQCNVDGRTTSKTKSYRAGKARKSDPLRPCQVKSTAVVPPFGDQSGSVSLPSSTAKFDNLNELSGHAIYQHFYNPAVTYVLKPFFFASIGFSIPITQMFHGAIFWRGLVYTVLMLVGKLICGLVLVRFTGMPTFNTVTEELRRSASKDQNEKQPVPHQTASSVVSNPPILEAVLHSTASPAPVQSPSIVANTAKKRQSSRTPKPQSLYPAAMLGSAMVARGEIGFLISSLAQSTGVFGTGSPATGGSSEVFLVVTWAILLCTIIGPVSVGVMAKRVKRLQAEERSRKTGYLLSIGH